MINNGDVGTRFDDGDFVFPDEVDNFKQKVFEGNKFRPSGGNSISQGKIFIISNI